MERKSKLNKPYNPKDKIDFIIRYNHNLGFEIRETDSGLEAWGYTEEEIKQAEKERVAKLSLTAADVERAIYKAKGMDFEDIISIVEKYNEKIKQEAQAQELEPQGLIDIKALKIELKANNFYRANPFVEKIGNLLDYSSEDLDYLFLNKELPECSSL